MKREYLPRGGGEVCALHFRREERFQRKDDKIILVPSAVPSQRLEGLSLEEIKVKEVRRSAFEAVNCGFSAFSIDEYDLLNETDEEDEDGNNTQQTKEKPPKKKYCAVKGCGSKESNTASHE